MRTILGMALGGALVTGLAFAFFGIGVSQADPAEGMGDRSAGDLGKFLVLSDIHFDPFVNDSIARALNDAPVERWSSILGDPEGQSLSGYGEDSNWALMTSALENAASASGGDGYDFVLYAGDYLSHEFRQKYRSYVDGGSDEFQEFVIKTMRFVDSRLQETFPGIRIIPTLGNNDSVCGDYEIAPASPMLSAIADQWVAMTGGDSDEFISFVLGGFYAVPHPTVPNHRILVLNSVFWSTRYSDRCGPSGIDPGIAQIWWLAFELMEATLEGRDVSLLMHIPPGVNAYSSSQGGTCPAAPSPFYGSEYASEVLSLMNDFEEVLSNGYAGHTHMDSFRATRDSVGGEGFAIRITPSVSPIFDNTPAFAVVDYDRESGEQRNYSIHYLTNLQEASNGGDPVWMREYAFDAAYQEDGFGGEQAFSAAANIAQDSSFRAKFMEYYAVRTPLTPPVNEENWKSFTCAQTALSIEEFRACTCGLGGR